MITEIRNGKIISDGSVTVGKSLYIKDGKILSVTAEPIAADEIIDAEGSYVSPGFIDIHTHGAGGYDFTDGTPEDILAAALAHARHGTTTVYPTSPSVSHEELLSFIKNTEIAMRENRKGKPYIAGAHLEGPYFSLKQCGAQDPRYIKAPVPTEYREAVELADGVVKRISFAPELLGSAELCDLPGEQTPDVRADEAAGNKTPGEGHQADDDGNVAGSEHKGASDECQTEQAGEQHLCFGLGVFFSQRGDQVDGNCRCRGQHHSLKCGHGCGQKQDHDDGQKNQTQRSAAQNFYQQGGDYGINSALRECAT